MIAAHRPPLTRPKLPTELVLALRTQSLRRLCRRWGEAGKPSPVLRMLSQYRPDLARWIERQDRMSSLAELPCLEEADDTLAIPEDDEDPAGFAVAGSHGLSVYLTVLDQIGDPQSSDGQAAAARFGSLAEPVWLRKCCTDPDAVYGRLQSEFPWMAEANAHVAGTVALTLRGQGWFRAAPLLLVGPPGIGKTRWARRVADAVGTTFAWMSLAGLDSSMAITGAERGWSTGKPGFAAISIAESGVANPILLLDEVDKSGRSGRNGDPLAALLPLLEVETARRFADNFLLGNLNLSAVSWVLTANTVDGLPAALLSRLEVLHVRRPSERDALRAVPHMVRETARQFGVPAASMPDVMDLMPQFRACYAEQRSLRSLRTAVEGAIRARIWSPRMG